MFKICVNIKIVDKIMCWVMYWYVVYMVIPSKRRWWCLLVALYSHWISIASLSGYLLHVYKLRGGRDTC